MKKFIAAVLVLNLLIFSAGNSIAYAARIVSRGNATGLLKQVIYISDQNGERVNITAINYTDYSLLELSNPKRIVLDIYNLSAPGKQKIIATNGEIVRRVRYAQFDKYTARVVLDVNDNQDYGVEKTKTGLTLYIGEKHEQNGSGDKTGGTLPDQTNTGNTGSGQTGTDQTNTGNTGSGQTGTDQTNTGNTGSGQTGTDQTNTGNTGSGQTGTDQTNTGNTGSGQTGTDQTNTGNTGSGQTDTDQTNTGYTGSGQTGTDQTNTGNTGSGQTDTDSNSPDLQNNIKNIEYHNSGDRVYFILKDAVLTEGDKDFKELYTGSYDDTGKKYTLTFKTGKSDLGSGLMKIGDKYLNSLEVRNNREDGTTSLIFDANDRYKFFAFTRDNSELTSVTILKPAEEGNKIVVIDAGHGDSATGAIYRNLEEKNLNLDIALRLNTLLREKGVNTYMLREDDSYIANYERVYIANKLNAALYLSIHNNALDNPNYGGTTTLYCPSDSSSFNGKNFASIIQSLVPGALNTIDRKIISRPDLIVLRETFMPAALVEVAYMTNSSDRANLQNDDFRQKATQALCESILRALSNVK